MFRWTDGAGMMKAADGDQTVTGPGHQSLPFFYDDDDDDDQQIDF